MTLSFSFELPQATQGPVSATFTHTPAPRRIMVAIADASGAVYGARLLQVLQGTPGIEPHLMVSPAGWHSIEHEMLRERRRLVLMVCETPLHLAQLRNMLSVTEMGAIVCPPVPAFHLNPQDMCDLVNDNVAQLLDLLEVPHKLANFNDEDTDNNSGNTYPD